MHHTNHMNQIYHSSDKVMFYESAINKGFNLIISHGLQTRTNRKANSKLQSQIPNSYYLRLTTFYFLLSTYYLLLSTKYISISPLPFAEIFPRVWQLNLSLTKAYVVSEILIFPGSLCCSIRAAVLTVSPQIS